MNKINPAWIAYKRDMLEGGEGYNPHPKYISVSTAKPIAAASRPAPRMLRDERGNYIPADKLAARLAADEAALASVTDATAREMLIARIEYARKALA